MQKIQADTRGFALITMLIALVALTALATGGFLVSSSDLRVSQSHTAGSRAFQTTDAALYEHMGSHKRGDDTLSYSYPGGSATVAGSLLLDIGDGNTLHRLEAAGQHSPAEGGSALRNISVVAMLHDGGLKARAAITAGSGLFKNGSSGQLNGYDQATTSQCSGGAQTAVAGVAVGPGQYAQNGAQPVPDGNPPVDTSLSGLGHLQALGLDWAAITSGTYIIPDFTIPTDAWPNFATLDPDWWPVIYIAQPVYSLDWNHAGRGTIIAEGDITMTGNFVWDGIILIGGVLTSDGKQEVQGTTVAAMNMLLGQAVGQSSVGNGNKEFSYNSCAVKLAAQQFSGGLIQVPGTWSEGM